MSPTPYTPSCFRTCQFSLCPSSPFYPVGIPDVAFTPPICKRDTLIGHVDSTGEAYFVVDGEAVPVSQYVPPGLNAPFSPSFFKSMSADGTVYPGDRSGVGHENLQENQADFLDGQCVVLPLRSYQVLGHYGQVVENRHPSDDLRDCVAFKIRLEQPAATEVPAKTRALKGTYATGGPHTTRETYGTRHKSRPRAYRKEYAPEAPRITHTTRATEKTRAVARMTAKAYQTKLPVYTEPPAKPPVYTPATRPPVYSKATKPAISTGATKPPIYTEATKPRIYTEATKPPIYTEATKPPVRTKATKPPVRTEATKPTVPTEATKPQISTKVTRPTTIIESSTEPPTYEEPPIQNYPTEPPVLARR